MKAVPQGDVKLLEHPSSQEMLQSKIPARFAYVWMDGTPRVIPIWFHWNGSKIVMASSAQSSEAQGFGKESESLADDRRREFSAKSAADSRNGATGNSGALLPSIKRAAHRYFTPEQAKSWLDQLRKMAPSQVRITITPEWVGLLDFKTRFPSALSS